MSKAFDEQPRRGPVEPSGHAGQRQAGGVTVPRGGPGNPMLSVRNARRAAQVFPDLRSKPNITGTYVERGGRARLFINHVGGHIEALLTLTSRQINFHETDGRTFKALQADLRLPQEWGYAGLLPGTRRALAYRLCGLHTGGGEFLLGIPEWLGPKVPEEIRTGDPNMTDTGTLAATGGGNALSVHWPAWFIDRWHPSASKNFSKSVREGNGAINFERADAEPVLLERYVARSSVSYGIRSLLWFGTFARQVDALGGFADAIKTQTVRINPKTYEVSKHGDSYNLFELMELAREADGLLEPTAHRTKLVEAADRIIQDVTFAALSAPLRDGGLTQSEKHLLVAPFLQRLNDWGMPAAGKYPAQSVASMLQSTVDASSSFQLRAPRVTEFLGIKARGYRAHNYELDGETVTLLQLASEDLKNELDKVRKRAKNYEERIKKAIDAALEAAEAAGRKLGGHERGWRAYRRLSKWLPMTYSMGWVHVKYVGSGTAHSSVAEEPWEAFYGFFIGGLKFSKSVGSATSTTPLRGFAQSWGAEAMRPEDLAGMLQYMDASAVFASESFVKAGGGKAALSFLGDLSSNAGRQGALSFILEGTPTASEGSWGGAAASFKGMAGAAWLLTDSDPEDIEIPIPDPPKGDDGFDTFWENHLGPMQVFFPINGAQFEEPTDDEQTIMEREQRLSPKQALDAFAAAELPLMINPLSVFKLEGFADAPDDENANRELSQQRALTVARYVDAVVGPNWRNGEEMRLFDPAVPGIGVKDKPARIAIIGQGEVSSGTNDYNQADRRVDLACTILVPDNSSGEEQPIEELAPGDFETKFPLIRETKGSK